MKRSKIPKTEEELADEAFDVIFPRRYKQISKFHFTPVKVAEVAAKFLVKHPGDRILDVGAGAGKFCMVGAGCTEGHFTGIEQRPSLYRLAVKLVERHGIQRVNFLHANAVEVDFRGYDGIYYFNSFFENLVQDSAIDKSAPMDKTFYTLYTQYMREQLGRMPVGTRLVTYFSFMDEVPGAYRVQFADFDLKLKCWEKVS